MDKTLAIQQTLRYAEELRQLHDAERVQRARAERTLARLEESYRTTVRALAAALELRDDITGNHAERVTQLAILLTERVAPELAADPELEYGFLLHDLGKIGIPDAILLKPGPLEPDEFETMRAHPALGERIVARIPYLSGVARQVVVAHHERWDGAGYPSGLAGEAIPLPARIFALADSFDAMTNDRPYRSALPRERAIEEIRNGAGRQFDPSLTAVFVELAPPVRRSESRSVA
jgi:HD-GYP domain-containing protein (c-di-GMP phosphodiesterase class II)